MEEYFRNNSSTPDITVVGNISYDHYCFYDGSEIVYPGGAAYNLAVSAKAHSRQTVHIRVLSHVGRDFNLNDLDNLGVDKEYIEISEDYDTNSFYFESQTGLLKSFPAQYLETIKVPESISTKHLHVSCRNGVPDPLSFIQKIRHEQLSLDVMYPSLRLFAPKIINCLKFRPKFVFMNQVEANELSSIIPDWERTRDVIFVITDGSHPVRIMSNGEVQEFAVAPVQPRDLGSTIGAGDTFVGSFLVSYLANQDLSTAIRSGIAMAGKSMTKYGVSHIAL